jgi:hypothetical protein
MPRTAAISLPLSFCRAMIVALRSAEDSAHAIVNPLLALQRATSAKGLALIRSLSTRQN